MKHLEYLARSGTEADMEAMRVLVSTFPRSDSSELVIFSLADVVMDLVYWELAAGFVHHAAGVRGKDEYRRAACQSWSGTGQSSTRLGKEQITASTRRGATAADCDGPGPPTDPPFRSISTSYTGMLSLPPSTWAGHCAGQAGGSTS